MSAVANAKQRSGSVWARLLPTGLLAALACTLAPSTAAAAACPSSDPKDSAHLGNCGPTVTVPTWTDAGGWNDPSQYSTIQLADVNGDGSAELLGRGDAGVQIYWFDTKLGQWRPQVDANGVPQILKDFASFPPWKESHPANPAQPQFYTTIQTAPFWGSYQKTEPVVARLRDGVHLYAYFSPLRTPGAIDGGEWHGVKYADVFSDANGYADPSLYSTLQAAQLRTHPGVTNDDDTVFARRHSNPGDPTLKLFGELPSYLNGVMPDGPADKRITSFSDDLCSNPSCYLSIQTADVDPTNGEGRTWTAEVFGRNSEGVVMWYRNNDGSWNRLNQVTDAANGPPFGDRRGFPDCPFSAAGATGAGSDDCVGTSPSYYETLQAADVDGLEGDEVIARASDGLRVRKWVPGTSGGTWQSLATLTALAGAASDVVDGMWGSIRTGDIDGDGKQEVLFLNAGGLQAWTYDRTTNRWSQMPASPALELAADPWLSHPEYYSTIRTGDVDGDGRDDVIARGPHGIRTWFYNRRNTGGWERYLPEVAPDSQPTTNQCGSSSDDATVREQCALTVLTTMAKSDNVIDQSANTVRDLWASAEPPKPTDLQDLQAKLPIVAGCTGGPGPANPPTYQSCTPPANSTGFTADDWTTVVNQMLAGSYYAIQVLALFDDLQTVRDHMLLVENPVLPAIGSALGLEAAAGNTADFNPMGMVSGTLGIAASLAGVIPDVGTALSAALWVGAEMASMIPTSSPTASSSSLPSKYADLAENFAKMAGEIEKGLEVQSHLVRKDPALLALFGQLRASGAWRIDTVGLESAADQSFAISVYQALMPTVYDRYIIRGCRGGYTNYHPGGSADSIFWNFDCYPAPDVPGVTTWDSQTFVSINQRNSPSGYPCFGPVDRHYLCAYDRLPGMDTRDANPSYVLSRRIWGVPSTDCAYQPGKPETKWTYGCWAGVDAITSIVSNTWGFPSHWGNPDFPDAWSCYDRGKPQGCASSAAAQVRSQSSIRLARPRIGHRRAVRGRARLQADIGTLRGMRLARATLRVDRMLFERRHGELTHPRRAQRPLKLRLRRTAAGRFAATSKGRRPVRIVLQRGPGGHASLTLTSRRVFHTPRACHALAASVADELPSVWLHSRVVIGDGQARVRVPLSHHLQCARDARGNVNRLEPVRYRRHPLRRGLGLALRGPSQVQPGATARYTARVRNHRRRGDRVTSSLWGVTVDSAAGTKHIRELRRGRSRTVTFTLRVPRTARGRFCANAFAGVPGVLAADARACARVAQAGDPPGVTG